MDRRLLFIVVVYSVLTGCRANQLQHDQDHMRQRLLELQTAQIMDNLIRAYQGFPLLQLDYTKITGTITQDANAGVQGSQTAANLITNFVAWTTGASQTQQLTVTADPVVDSNEVYNAYLSFIRKPNRFLATTTPPPPEAVHIVECRCGVYYWVPAEFKYDFLQLALVTSVLRGQPLDIPANFEVTVSRALKIDPIAGTTAFDITLQFDQKLPNASGSMTAVVNGQQVTFLVRYFAPAGPEDPQLRYGEDIDRLVLEYRPERLRLSPAAFIQAIADQQVEIELAGFAPRVPSTTDQLIKDLNNEVRLFRMDQLAR